VHRLELLDATEQAPATEMPATRPHTQIGGRVYLDGVAPNADTVAR